MPPKSNRPLRKRLTEATPSNSPVLCLVKTGCATGSNLVATLHTTLETTLTDIRAKLSGIAAVGRRGAYGATVGEGMAAKPINYTAQSDLDKVLQSRLHAFDLTAPFRFVHRGGSRSIDSGREGTLKLIDVIPRIPAVGLPTTPQWNSSPPFGTVVVQQSGGALCEAIVVVFVAQGGFTDDMHSERVVSERLMLQQQSYGRQMTVKQLSTVVNKWNGNVKDFIGRTLLHECGVDGNLAALRYLLSQSFIVVDEQDNEGNTALALAVRSGHEDCVLALLEVGANILQPNEAGVTPLHWSLYRRFDNMTDILCSRLRLTQQPRSTLTALVDSTGYHPQSLFKELTPAPSTLVLDGDVRALRAMCQHFLFSPQWLVERHGDSLLHVAARGGSEEMVRFLLEETSFADLTADKMLLNSCKRSPLHIACLYGHTAVVRRLLSVMPTMAIALDNTRRTPLQLALYKGHIATAEFLLDNCSDVNVDSIDSCGHSALHTAASLGALEVVRRLVQVQRANVALRSVTTLQRNTRQTKAPSPVNDINRNRLAIAARYRKQRTSQKRTSLSGSVRSAPVVSVTTTHRGPSTLWCAATGGARCGPTLAFLLTVAQQPLDDENDTLMLGEVLWKVIARQDFDLASGVVKLMGPHAPRLAAATLHRVITESKPNDVRRALRWMMDRKAGTAALAQAFAAACGCSDVATVQTLIAAGASATTPYQGKLPIQLAIEKKNTSVVEELLRHGARATSTDEASSPIAMAAGMGLESIVRGLCTLPYVSTFDCVVALRRVWERCNRVAYQQAVHEQKAIASLSLALGQRVQPLDSQLHFVEMLHAAAASKMFPLVQCFVEKMLKLPNETRRVLLSNAQAAPEVQRIPIVIPPRRRGRSKKPESAGKGEARVQSLTRPQLRKYDPLELTHRRCRRDVYSYSCEHGHVDVVEVLVSEVRLPPWRLLDCYGRNAADYAIIGGHYMCALWMACLGLLPSPNVAVDRISSKLKQLLTASRAAASITNSAPESAGLAEVLVALIQLGFNDVLFDLLNCAARGKCAPLNVMPLMVRAAVRTSSGLPFIMKLMEWYTRSGLSTGALALSTTIADGSEEIIASACLAGVSTDILCFLLRSGCPAASPTSISKETARRLRKRGLRQAQASSRVTPLVIAAAIGRVDLMTEIVHYVKSTQGSLNDCEDNVFSDLLKVAVLCNLSNTAVCLNMVKALRSHFPVTEQLLVLVTHRQLIAVAEELFSSDSFANQSISHETMVSVMSTLLRCPNRNVAPLAIRVLTMTAQWDKEEDKEKLQSFLDASLNAAIHLAGLASVASVCLLLGGRLAHGGRDYKSITLRELASVAGQTPKDRSALLVAMERRLPFAFNALLSSIQHFSEKEPTLLPKVLGSITVSNAVAAGYSGAEGTPSEMYKDWERFIDTSGITLEHGLPAAVSDAISNCILGGGTERSIISILTAMLATLQRRTSSTFISTALQLPVDLLLNNVTRLAQSNARRHRWVDFVLEQDRLAVTRSSPLGLAVLRGNEAIVRLLLDYGATSQCNATELAPTYRFSNKKSEVEERKPLFLRVDPRSPRHRTSALLLALRRLSLSSQSKQQSAVAIVKLLVRRGALTRDVINIVAMQLARHEAWDALSTVIDESATLLKRHNGNSADGEDDRFFRSVKDIPLLLKNCVPPYTHVMHACARKAPRDVILLVARHSRRQDVESCADSLDRTPLYYAASARNVVALETLAALHVPMNTACDKRSGRSALMVAASIGDLPSATLLLKHGGINASDAKGNTPLMLACASGNQSLVELLLSTQADASLVNDAGLTAVMIAAQRGRDGIALPLAQHFSRLQCYTTGSSTLLHCAAQGGCVKLVQYLLRTFDTLSILDTDLNGASALYLAYAFGRGDILRQFLGALRVRTEKPTTETDTALLDCSSKLVRYGWLSQALELGETLQERRRSTLPQPTVHSSIVADGRCLREKSSLLTFCAQTNNAVGVRVLGDLGVIDDCHAVHVAAACGSLDVLQLLLALEMSLATTKDSKGRTALDCALAARKEDCCQFLLQKATLTDLLPKNKSSSSDNIFHRIAAYGLHTTLSTMVQNAFAASDGRSTVAVDLLRSALSETNEDGLTPFEVAICCGSAETALKFAQIQQQCQAMGSGPQQSDAGAAVTISVATLQKFPSLSPSVRSLLLDFFGVTEVMDPRVFAELGSNAAHSKHSRLLFGDVRMIGINALRQCPYMDQKTELVLTVNHERQILKNTTQMMNLPFRLKFNAEGLKLFVPEEQARVLQWLGTSVILGKYLEISRKGGEGYTPLATVEVDVVASVKQISIQRQGASVSERFCWTPTTIVSPPIDFIGTLPKSAKSLLSQVVKSMKNIVTIVQKQSHPAMQQLQMKLSWNGYTPASTDGSFSSLAAVGESLTPEVTEKALTALTQTLNSIASYVSEGKIQDAQQGVDAAAIATVYKGPSPITAVHLRFYPTWEDVPEVKDHLRLEGTELIIPFCPTGTATGSANSLFETELRVKGGLEPLHELVLKDVTILRIHRVRDQFVSTIGKETGLDGWKFKLEVESAHLVDLPQQELVNVVIAAVDAVSTILDPVKGQSATAPPLSWRKLHTANIVAQSVRTHVRLVSVLYSKARPAEAHRSGPRLVLSFNDHGGPSSAEIYDALWRDTVAHELMAVREGLPQLLADMMQRLNTYLPSTSLHVDLPAITKLAPEDALAALSLLSFNRSAMVLQEIIKGVSIGWDTKLGTIVRRHVRQISLLFQPGFDHATTSLEPDGRLVLRYPLACVQMRRCSAHLSRWHVPTSQMIASLLLIQLHSLHKEVAKMVDVRQGYACWCTVSCRNVRMTAGSSRGQLSISARNVLNRPVYNTNDIFELKSDRFTEKELSSYRITTPPLATSRKPKEAVYKLRFSASTTAQAHRLSLRLHGQELCLSPVTIQSTSTTIDVTKTQCISTFNTIIDGEKFVLRYRLFDMFGNGVPTMKRELLDVRSAAVKGVAIDGWSFVIGGDVEVSFRVTTGAVKSLSLPLQFTYEDTSYTVSVQMECISPETGLNLMRLQRNLLIQEATKVNNTRTYFRAKVRDAAKEKAEREIRLIGGIDKRVLPKRNIAVLK